MSEAPAGSAVPARIRPLLRGVQSIFAVVILIVAIRGLHKLLADFRWHDLVQYLGAQPRERVGIAILLTFAGYLIMTGYDTFAFRYIDRRLPYRRIALASFAGYAINNNLGLSGVVGTSLRYRFYSSWGVPPGEIARVYVFCTVSYWLGFDLLGGIIFLLHPPMIPPHVHLPFASIRLLGAVLLVPGVAYFLWVVIRRKPLRLRGWELVLPKPSMFAAQVVISMADWMIAGAVLLTLLPNTVPLRFIHILGIFLLAQLGGLVSNVPGGLGVFEAISVVLLAPYLPTAEILGTLIAFRGIYFLLPLVAALLLLASHFMTARRQIPKR